jgi:hypothetical protein
MGGVPQTKRSGKEHRYEMVADDHTLDIGIYDFKYRFSYTLVPPPPPGRLIYRIYSNKNV